MSILVLNDFVEFPGGGTAVARFCAEGLAGSGREVSFLAGAGKAPASSPYAIRTLGLQDVREGRAVQRLLDGVFSLQGLGRLKRALKAFPPASTKVILHQWTRVLSPAVFAALKDYEVFVYAHDYFLTCPNGALYDFRLRRPCGERPLSRGCVMRDCDRQSRAHKVVRLVRGFVQARLLRRLKRLHVIYVSAGQAARYGALFPSHATPHILPVVPLSPPPQPAAKSETSARSGVAFVGRMVPEKGVMELAEAARRTGTPCTFLGSGPLQVEVAERYPEHGVRGWVEPGGVQAAIRAARAVVAPSRWPETACLAAAEPLAAGTPVAMAEVICSTDELAADGGVVTFDADSPAALEAMLERIGSPDGWTSTLEAAAQRAARSDYEEARRRYLDRLEAILDGAQVKGSQPPPSALVGLRLLQRGLGLLAVLRGAGSCGGEVAVAADVLLGEHQPRLGRRHGGLSLGDQGRLVVVHRRLDHLARHTRRDGGVVQGDAGVVGAHNGMRREHAPEHHADEAQR